jgi:rare lipoprotein A
VGKRIGKTKVLAIVLLYLLVSANSASAGFFDWLADPLITQSINDQSYSPSADEWDERINIKNDEPLSKISKENMEALSMNKYFQPILTLKGEASFYHWDGCLGCNPKRIMANGKTLDDNALTMAIGADRKHLVGRQAKVTNLASGKSAIVTITDTGGFYQEKYGYRVADLTIGTKKAIGMEGGLAQVTIEVF